MYNIIKIHFIVFYLLLPQFLFSQNENQSAQIEVLVNKLRLAESSFNTKKTIKYIVKLNPNYDLVEDIIRNHINYSDDVQRDYIEWEYVLDSIDHLSILFVPTNYSPDKKYPVSFILHGAASTFNSDILRLYINKDSYNCDSLDRIVIYPRCWIICPWWREEQINNLNYLIDKLKLTYSIDENNVHLSGISDGGTGIIYQANLNVTPWASFRPYISNPGGLKRLSDRTIFIKNLGNRPFLFISSEKDETFPPHLMDSFLEKMKKVNNPYQYFLASGFKHEISWMPIYSDTIRKFYQNNSRTQYPPNLFWQTDNIKYGRNSWVIIDKLSNKDQPDPEKYPEIKSIRFETENPSGLIEVNSSENIINVKTINVKQYTLLLSPEQFDFEKEIQVYTNDELSFKGTITKDIETLLKWYKKDLDRTMLFGTELTIKVN